MSAVFTAVLAKNKVLCPNYSKIENGKRLCDNYLGMSRLYMRKKTPETENKQRYVAFGWYCETCGHEIHERQYGKPGAKPGRRRSPSGKAGPSRSRAAGADRVPKRQILAK